MITRFRVVAMCAALTMVGSTVMAQTSPRRSPSPTPSPMPTTEVEYEEGQTFQGEFAPSERGEGCGATAHGCACGHDCGCTVGTAMHVGYPRCFNFRSPCTGGHSCGGCGTIFGELACDIRDWGIRMRSYRVASCSTATCSTCGSVGGAGCSCSTMGTLEPSCDGGFEPGCGMVADSKSCFRTPSWGCGLGGLSCLFGGSRTTSCGCNGCNAGGSCCCGSPRDAAAYGNTWYPANGGSGYSVPPSYPQGGSYQDAPIEPIPVPQGSVSGNYSLGRGRKSIHYYTQVPTSVERPMHATGPANAPVSTPRTQIARAPQNSTTTLAPLPLKTTEPEVRVHEEIPAAPQSIRRMSYEAAPQPNTTSRSSEANATIRFADEEK